MFTTEHDNLLKERRGKGITEWGRREVGIRNEREFANRSERGIRRRVVQWGGATAHPGARQPVEGVEGEGNYRVGEERGGDRERARVRQPIKAWRPEARSGIGRGGCSSGSTTIGWTSGRGEELPGRGGERWGSRTRETSLANQERAAWGHVGRWDRKTSGGRILSEIERQKGEGRRKARASIDKWGCTACEARKGLGKGGSLTRGCDNWLGRGGRGDCRGKERRERVFPSKG